MATNISFPNSYTIQTTFTKQYKYIYCFISNIRYNTFSLGSNSIFSIETQDNIALEVVHNNFSGDIIYKEKITSVSWNQNVATIQAPKISYIPNSSDIIWTAIGYN